jgi:hypothetical protein
MTYKFGFVSGANQFKGSIKVCTITFKYTGNKPQTITMSSLTVARLTGMTVGGLPEVKSENVAWGKTFSVSRSSGVPSYTGAVQTAAKPAAKPKEGTYFGDIYVKLTSATTGAAIYYTTDGTVPTRSSPQYKEEILIDESATLKAVSVLGGYNDSEVSSFEYVIKPLFADAVNHWAREYIASAASMGYITGFPDGTVRPNDPVTRAQFVKMVVTAFGLKAGNGGLFADCVTHWAKDYISAAADNGLITGVRRSDGSYFLPEDKITREQAAAILYRLAGTLKIGLPETSVAAEFSDMGKIQDYALPAVLAMQKAGIISGAVKDGAPSFNPGGNTTRAEAVKMIQGMLELYTKGEN